MKGEALARRAAELAVDGHGEDVVVLDLRQQSPLADWFVLVTAGSTVHAQALAEELAGKLKAAGQRPHHVEGTELGHWILLDYFDVVVHILLGDVREFYGLERLWGDAPRQVFDTGTEFDSEAGAAQRRQTGGAT
jgi:ribosome-associated protein